MELPCKLMLHSSELPYLCVCKPQLIDYVSSFRMAYNQGRLTLFHLFTLSKGIDDAP